MTAHLIKTDDGKTIGFLTNEELAEKIDGDRVFDENRDYYTVEIEEVENDDLF